MLSNALLTDREIDAILELFHESLYSEEGILCIGVPEGECSYGTKLGQMRSLFESIEDSDLLLRIYDRLSLITERLQENRVGSFGHLSL